MEHDAEFMHLFPRMWNYKFSDEDYKPWAAYRTRTEVLRDENGEILRDPQGRPQRGEVLDFGRKRIYTTADGESYAILEPTFAENLNYFFNYQLSYMYWRYFLWNFVGRQSDIQPSRSPITDGNWLSGIRSSSVRRRTFLPRWPATGDATPTTSCRSCWGSSASSTSSTATSATSRSSCGSSS